MSPTAPVMFSDAVGELLSISAKLENRRCYHRDGVLEFVTLGSRFLTYLHSRTSMDFCEFQQATATCKDILHAYFYRVPGPLRMNLADGLLMQAHEMIGHIGDRIRWHIDRCPFDNVCRELTALNDFIKDKSFDDMMVSLNTESSRRRRHRHTTQLLLE